MAKATLSESWSDRMYRALLRLLPFDFRNEFGDEMEETFREQRNETERERGMGALLRMWWATIKDIFAMAPREHLSVLAQDTRYALRMMINNLGFTTVAVLILGLGIGANTAIFSVVNSVLLKPLPYLQGDRLVVLHQQAAKAGVKDMRFSVHEINDYRDQNRTLSGLVEYHGMQFTLLGRGEATRVKTGVVSAGFFNLFGIRPVLGRTFVPEDDRPGAPAVLVLSYEFWKSNQGGDPNIVGKRFEMNDRVHTVIGVLPKIPQFPDENDLYMPTSACPTRSSKGFIENRDARMMSVFGRLKADATLDRSRADLAGIANRLQTAYPKSYKKTLGYSLVPGELREELTTRARPMLLVLLGAAAFVLIIACANVANLILARMARRERELVIRTAVGAGSGRLLRQLLTESLILAMLAAGVGLLFASGSLELLKQFAAQLTPRAREISIDGWVLLFAIACATITTVVFSSIAALHARKDVSAGLKESDSPNTAGSRRNLIRGSLIAAQVTFSYVLLIGAGLMVHTLIQLDRVDPGFVPERVFAVGINLNWSKYGTGQSKTRLQNYREVSNRILEKVQAQPGVVSAAISSSFPLDPETADGSGFRARFRIEGSPLDESETPIASFRTASPDYFRTLGIPLLKGRTFTDADHQDAPLVAVISRSLAQQRWGDADPLRRKITFDNGETWVTVIGIVGDVKEAGLQHPAPNQLYRPLSQVPFPGSVLVRGTGDPTGLARQVRRAILEVDPQTAITQVETLEQARADSISSPRTTARLFMVFGGLALLIAVAGIASMLALSVRQRTREIGIRVALGAKPMDVVNIILRQGMLLVVLGLAFGIAGALALTRLLKALLFEVTPTDLTTFVSVSLLLLGAALVACYLPARRAARIDPQLALRMD